MKTLKRINFFPLSTDKETRQKYFPPTPTNSLRSWNVWETLQVLLFRVSPPLTTRFISYFPAKPRKKNSGKNLKSMTTFSFFFLSGCFFLSFPSYLQWKKGENNHDKSNIIWGKSGRGFVVAKLFWFRSVSRRQWNGGTRRRQQCVQKCETAVSFIDYDKQGNFFARIKETEKYNSDENAECTVVSSTLPEIGRTTFCGLPRRWKEEESISKSPRWKLGR